MPSPKAHVCIGCPKLKVCDWECLDECKAKKENAIIIAEFMGGIIDSPDFIGVDGLKYHCDWNSLMPVLKKVRELPVFVNTSKKYIDAINHALDDVDILSLNMAITDFIKWYGREGAEEIRKDDERIKNL